MSWIQMRDFWTFKPLEVSENKRHLFECKDSQSDTNHSLLVHVAASHSGIVNGNKRFYRPDKMQESINTWLPQKASDGTILRTARPVLIGHDEKGEVLGRVLEAKYIDESWKYATDFPVVKDFVFYQRDGRKRQNLYDSVDWVVDNLVPLEEYTGLGYTDLGLRITNPEAIRKVLADEYLTVSVGFRTDAAVCSLCHTDWATDGKCGHKLGEMEDGKSMFLIAGQLHNQEVSFINFAADPFATTLSKKVLTDSLEKMFFLGLPINEQNNAAATNGLQLSDGLLFESDLQAAEEPMESVIDMSTLDLSALSTELKSEGLTQERAKEVKDSLFTWAPESEDLKSKRRSLVSTVNAKIRKNGWDKFQDSVSETDGAVTEELRELMEDGKKKKSPAGPSGQSKGVSKKEEKGAKEFQQKEIAGKTEHDPDNKECTCEECSTTTGVDSLTDFSSWVASSDEDRDYFADADGIQGELVTELGEVSLGTDSFCGPQSTFPVPDVIHATAARKVIAKAKFSDSLKTQILANIAIKEKGFSVTSTATEVTDGADARMVKYIDTVAMQDATAPKVVTQEQRNALVTILKDLDKNYDALSLGDVHSDVKWICRMAVRAMLEDWSADDQVAWALKALAGNKDHVVLTRSEIDEKDEALNGLMTEKDSLTVEVKNLTESRALILSATKTTLAQQIVMHNVMKGTDGYKDLTPETLSEKIATLSKRHITSLKDSVSDILSGLKFTDSTPAASTHSDATEAVDDHMRITDATPNGTTSKDGVQDEADPARELLLTKLRYMTPTERSRELSRLRYESAKTK